ncbi:MAG: MCE family protein [Alphaproteobacteria bacterium]|nr:MCE family protein [Alphaproteobacteria bacterium]
MTNLAEPPVLARATARRSRRISIIWVIPLVALAIGAWLAYDTLSKEGPTITVTFDSGEGLQAGQSQLKYRDIVFGTVKSLALTRDHNHVDVTIATTAQAEPLLTNTTAFWVVKPRLFAGNISGLETLLSGSYVGMMPGATGGKAQRAFEGREDPPILTEHVPGREFLLKARRLGSISLGSPIFFRDQSVGEVLGWELADMAEYVTIHAFVRHPYDGYVNDQTRFWNASGLSIKLAGAGVEIQLESLKALLLGGIAFQNPDLEGKVPAVAAENHIFELFADRDAADAASYTRKIEVVSYFPGSVSGLGPGSPVTMHGLTVGQVLGVELKYDTANDTIVAPVRYVVEPERIIGVGQRRFKTDQEAVEAVVKKGLRATLQSANLITGQQQVALDFVPNAPPAAVEMHDGHFILPTTEGGGFAGLAASASELLNKVNTIQFDKLGQSLNQLLQSTDALVSGPQLRDSLTKLSATLSMAETFTRNLNTGTAPAFKQLPDMSKQLQTTLNNTNKLLVSVDAGYGDNTKFYRDLDRLLVQTTDALNSLRALSDLLSRHPEALIKGRPAGGVE